MNTQSWTQLLGIEDSEIEIRQIEEEDYYKGYFELLSQLTSAEKPDYCAFAERISELRRRNCENITVVEFLPTKKIIGTITYFTELKFIHKLGKTCHLEDFVVDSNFRNKHWGSKLIQLVKQYAQQEGCYKIILDCDDNLIKYYERFGFMKKANSMQLYYI